MLEMPMEMGETCSVMRCERSAGRCERSAGICERSAGRCERSAGRCGRTGERDVASLYASPAFPICEICDTADKVLTSLMFTILEYLTDY
jgi:hypothetical protein